jgi:hypothetical protein
MNDKEKRKIKSTIINHLKEGFVFIPHEDARIRNVYPSQTQEVGFLHKGFRLNSLINESGSDKTEILAILDNMSRRRQIKIFSMVMDRSLNSNDILFFAEIGRGIQQPTNYYSMEIVSSTFYWEKGRSLSLKDFHFGGKTILQPSLKAKELKDEKNRYFEQRFGTVDASIERSLHREDLIAQAEVASAIVSLSRKLAEDKK